MSLLKVNEDAVQQGVIIQRVFILTKDTLAKANDVLDLHQRTSVQVFIINPEELPNTELLESFLNVDDKVLVVFHYTRDGHKFTEERVSIEPVELDKAISKFDTIILRAKPYKSNDEQGNQ